MYIVIEAEMEKGWEGCINGHLIHVLATLVVTLHLQLHFVKLLNRLLTFSNNLDSISAL